MKTSDFYYDLPQELIAQTPIEKRDTSRLMTLDRVSGATGHHHFYDLPDYLNPGDCLILNNSRVLPARLVGQRLPGGGISLHSRRVEFEHPVRREPVSVTAPAPADDNLWAYFETR